MQFKIYSPQQNIFADFSDDLFPITLRIWNQESVQLRSNGNHFGFVYQGCPTLFRHGTTQEYQLHPHMYFSLPGEGHIDGKTSSGIIITRCNYRGMFSLGGAIEPIGRFAYIDGGTNSLLIPPIFRGDPCLNALYLPPGVDQTWHTHPSCRIGLVVEGIGTCQTQQHTADLTPGTSFYIPANCLHKFRTDTSTLTVIVFHPDSDIGFTHRDNPMLKRTIVQGISADKLPGIQTKIEKTN